MRLALDLDFLPLMLMMNILTMSSSSRKDLKIALYTNIAKHKNLESNKLIGDLFNEDIFKHILFLTSL